MLDHLHSSQIGGYVQRLPRCILDVHHPRWHPASQPTYSSQLCPAQLILHIHLVLHMLAVEMAGHGIPAHIH